MYRKLLVSLVLGAGLMLSAASPSAAAISNGLSVVRDSVAQNDAIVDAQFLFGGRQYCWYDEGWRGPGWYWCGYAMRRGFGWGGGVGWNNWHRGGHGRPGFGGGGRPGFGGGGGHRPGFGGGGGRPGHGGGGGGGRGHRGGGGGGHRR